MAISIDQLKAAFSKNNDREGGNTGRANNYYPFWNMKEGDQAVIRFLPDKNPENPRGFMVEKLVHTLTINGEKKNIPCRKMYNEDCPICKVSSSFYKEGDKENGRKYWRNKQHLAQALIVEDPLEADEATGENHQGKVRFIALGYQLFNVIKEALQSGELDEIPFAYENGYNFIIKKTKQGEYSTYAVGSRFKSKPTTLSDEDIEAIQEQLVDLSTLLPKDLGEEKVTQMLEAALTGGNYSDESSDDESDDEPVVAKKPAPSSAVKNLASKLAGATKAVDNEDEEEDAPVTKPASVVKSVAKPTASAKADVDDDQISEEADRILAQIHARRAAKGK